MRKELSYDRPLACSCRAGARRESGCGCRAPVGLGKRACGMQYELHYGGFLGGILRRGLQEGSLRALHGRDGHRGACRELQRGLAQVRAQAETGNVHWDIVDLEFADVVLGCDEGLLELIDVDEFPAAPDGTPAREDYFEGTFSECGGGGLYYSSVVAYNREGFSGEGLPHLRTSSIWRSSPAGAACGARPSSISNSP